VNSNDHAWGFLHPVALGSTTNFWEAFSASL